MRAVIFANGVIAHPARDRAQVRADDWLLAADGGAAYARMFGFMPQVLIGDLDSVPASEHDALVAAGCEVLRFPARKNETDLELALRHAVTRADEVLVLGALGGRWDQTIANVLLLARPELRAHAIRLVDGPQELWLAPARIHGTPGDSVSLIPLGGDALGVSTRGLEYVLNEGTLPFGATLGVSNVLNAFEAEVTVRSGHVLVIHEKR